MRTSACSSILSVSVVLMAGPVLMAFASTNNLALTPPMGWNDWNAYHCGISESIVTNNAGVMVANGMKAAGYLYVDVDDGWASSRDSNGVIQAYSISGKFPHGIKWLADYVHSQGLKLGIYTDDGTNTCSSCISGATPPKDPGSYQYEYVDAFTYASWGADYLKDDNCNATGLDGHVVYGRMSDGLMRSGRPILFCLCGSQNGNSKSYQSWSPAVGNYWRTTGDIGSTFASMISHLDPNSTSAFVAGPGRWNDPDMLEIGNGEFAGNLTAAQTHFTMWCIMAAPLIAGNNITTMSAGTLQILTNSEAIAVDQDPAGEQGVKVFDGGSAEVWSKPLGYDFTTRAVALLNRDTNNSAVITCNWTNLALQNGPATVRDLWSHQDLGTFTNSFTATVPPYGSRLLKITGTPVPPPIAGTNYLSDRQPVYAYTGFGTMVKDKSIGGNTLTLGGTAYPKGIGVNSRSGVEYDLGGVCTRFQAKIGIDDETGSNGSVIFEAFADGVQIYNSGAMTGNTATKTIDLDMTGVRRLTLGVDDDDDGTGNDHADWANALVIVTNAPQMPHAPAGLAASPGNALTLAWNTTLAAITYNVKRTTNSGGPYTAITNVPLTTFSDANVAPGVNYFYVVTAVSSLGESANSTEVSVAMCGEPAAPTSVTTAVSNAQVIVQWRVPAGTPAPVSFIISRFTGSTPPVVLASGITTTNFTDATVSAGTTNYYLINAINACNQSGYSSFAAAALPVIDISPAPVWNGGSLVTSNWSDSANWSNVTLTAGNTLIFDGVTRSDNFNDTAANTVYSGITFDPGAGAFVLNGNPISLGGGIVNNSPMPQVVNLGLNFSNSVSFNGASNAIFIAGGLTNTLAGSGSTTLTLAGSGTLNNLLSSVNSPGGTNIIATTGNANWSLLDNASSMPVTVPWVFSLNSGTFNFGSSSSAPNLTATTPNNSPTDNQAGTVSGATGTFNMLGGTLTTSARLNTATALNSTGIVNQAGGIFNLGSQFQGANGGNAGEVSIVNLSDGTLNVSGGGGPFYVASRGGGTLNVSNGGSPQDALLNCGTLDVARNAAGNSITCSGVVNLNGGTLAVNRVGTATANAQTGVSFSPTATFNFNGGTLKAKTGSANFFQGSTVAPVIPIAAIVRSGGAIIDDGGFAIVFLEPLQHDPSLGPVPDGGLTKNGAGVLILASNVTYTGATLINAGTLVLSNSVALNSSPNIMIVSGAMLDPTGRGDQTLSLMNGQKLGGNGTVKGNVVFNSGATLSPGGPIGTLTFAGNLTLGGGSTTVMEINKSVAPSNDLVQVAGNLIYGGTLVVTNLGMNKLTAGDSFRLFGAADYSGSFTNLVPVIPGINLAWNTNGLTNGILSIVFSPTPPPVFGAVKWSGANFIFGGSAGPPGWPYYVLTSTNAALPLARWTVAATNNFDIGGGFRFTNGITPGVPDNFYMLQLAP